MALGTQSATIGGAIKSLIVATDGAGNLAAAHVLVDANGAFLGTSTNPLAVTSPSSAVSLAPGASTIGSVTQAGGPWSVSWSGQSIAATQSGSWTVVLATGSTVALGAGSAAIGTVGVTGSVVVTGTFFQNVQPISAVALPLPTGAAIAAAQPALHADGGALAHIQNLPATQAVTAASLPLPAGAAQDGTDATGITAPTGGVGIRGWLSGIYAKLAGTLTTTVSNTVAISATALPLPSGAATAAAQATLSAKLDALIAAEQPYQGVVAFVVDTAQPAQRAVRVACTTAGNVSLTYADSSTDVVPVSIGLSYIAGAVTKINSSGTTAVATFANMK